MEKRETHRDAAVCSLIPSSQKYFLCSYFWTDFFLLLLVTLTSCVSPDFPTYFLRIFFHPVIYAEEKNEKGKSGAQEKKLQFVFFLPGSCEPTQKAHPLYLMLARAQYYSTQVGFPPPPDT